LAPTWHPLASFLGKTMDIEAKAQKKQRPIEN
jgi:hypothetical protein